MTISQQEIELDHKKLTFGKYVGQTPDEVSEHDPKYIVWMYDNVTNKPTCSKTLRDACANEPKPVTAQKSERPLTGRLSFDEDDLYE